MELAEKLAVIEQVAEIFAAFQKMPLPDGLNGHIGGLSFDDKGDVIGAQMPLLPPGPWESLVHLWLSRFQQQLHDADKSSALDGWRAGGVRERLN
jgi:hypothetical protein